MTQDNSQKPHSLLQDFLNYFPGAKQAKPAESKPVEGPRIVHEPSIIIAMIESALAIDNPVMVQLPNDTVFYNSKFAIDAPPEIEALRTGQHLFIGPLDPPMGNIKVRKASSVTLRFFTERHIAELSAPYLGTVEGAIKLGFPLKAIQNQQKRSHPRIQVLPEFKIKLEVMRPSGIPFEAKLNDISLGGSLFCALKNEARLADGSVITMGLSGGKFPSIQINCIILGSTMKEDRPCYRVKFKGGTTEVNALKGFIDTLVQEHRRKREWLFRGKG
ncbi:MAG: PilZ domain-containing protein [Magnetococcales bacterium]|nr:PilZ domain-containing protein [Magnetococcales bacterium]